MSEKRISRRDAFSLLGLATVAGFAVPTTVLTTSDAEAQAAQPTTPAPSSPAPSAPPAASVPTTSGSATPGMERRHARRSGRQERREARRTAREKRREARQKGNSLYMKANDATKQK